MLNYFFFQFYTSKIKSFIHWIENQPFFTNNSDLKTNKYKISSTSHPESQLWIPSSFVCFSRPNSSPDKGNYFYFVNFFVVLNYRCKAKTKDEFGLTLLGYNAGLHSYFFFLISFILMIFYLLLPTLCYSGSSTFLLVSQDLIS